MLLRGHGDTVKIAVFRAIHTEANARLEAEALRLSKDIVFLNETEATRIAAENDRQIERPWEIWKSQAMRHGELGK